MIEKVKRIKEKAKPFPEESYKDLPLSDLVLYALFSLKKKSIETTFENIVAEAYELFPKKFHLPGYPDYPDANRVRREIQRIEGTLSTPGMKKLAKGNMKTSYEITEEGLQRLKLIEEKLARDLSTKISIEKEMEDRRGKMGRLLSEIEKHPLYRQYTDSLSKNNIEIPEHLLRDLLLATMETPVEELRERMERLIKYCEAFNKQQLKQFLELCKKKNKHIFSENY